MDGAKFNRLARALAKIINRRCFMGLASATTTMLGQRVVRGSQLGPATCGEEGVICTLLAGCCDGLTCVTSVINTSYGICVPSEGGMVSIGTTLISPFSETAVEEVTALLQSAAIAPATAPRADRVARTRDAKPAETQTPLTTAPSTRPIRTDKPNLRPQLKVRLQFGEVDSVPTEVVEVMNRDDVNVVLTRIEPIPDTSDGVALPTPQFTLGHGESYSFVSGLRTADATDVEYRWLDTVICDGTVTGQGYRLKAALSLDAKNYDYIVLCKNGRLAGAVETQTQTSRGKRKRNGQRQKKKKR